MSSSNSGTRFRLGTSEFHLDSKEELMDQSEILHLRISQREIDARKELTVEWFVETREEFAVMESEQVTVFSSVFDKYHNSPFPYRRVDMTPPPRDEFDRLTRSRIEMSLSEYVYSDL